MRAEEGHGGCHLSCNSLLCLRLAGPPRAITTRALVAGPSPALARGGLGPGRSELRADTGPDTRESRMCPQRRCSPRQRARPLQARPPQAAPTPVVSSARASGTTGLLGPGRSRWGGHTGSTGQPLLTRPPPHGQPLDARERPAAGGGEALPARPADPAGTDTRAARKGCRPGQEAVRASGCGSSGSPGRGHPPGVSGRPRAPGSLCGAPTLSVMSTSHPDVPQPFLGPAPRESGRSG